MENLIRICASQSPYRVFVTWYKSGEVIKVDRETGIEEHLGKVHHLEDLNVLLYEQAIQPMGYGRRGK